MSVQSPPFTPLDSSVDDRGEYIESAGALNRRADINVRTAGSCAS